MTSLSVGTVLNLKHVSTSAPLRGEYVAGLRGSPGGRPRLLETVIVHRDGGTARVHVHAPGFEDLTDTSQFAIHLLDKTSEV